MSPLVSVIMPAYNEEECIQAAVRSILGQTYPHLELLVVDDCSRDATPELLGKIADPRLRVLRLPENVGRAAARNVALDQFRGRYVAFMDADDLSEPHRLQRQVRFMEAHPEVDVLGSALRTVGGTVSMIGRPHLNHSHIQAEMLIGCSMFITTTMVRRPLIEEHGLRFTPGKYVEDFDFWEKALSFARFANIPDVLVQYHFVPEERGEDRARKQNDSESVFRAQLRRLGIVPTDREFSMHLALFRLTSLPIRTRRDVRDCVRWVDTLLSRNRDRGVYDQRALRAVLDQRMLEILNNVAYRRVGLLGLALRSSFARRNIGHHLADGVSRIWNRFGKTA